MKKGVLLFAHNNGDIKYTKVAAWAAHRIIQFLDVPVSLVTDQPLDFEHPFDQVIIADADSNSYRGAAPWRNMNRYRAGELSPYDHTILLDADYVVCSDQLKILFAIDQPLISMRWAHDATGRNSYMNHNYFGQNQMPSAWATVISWKRSHTADLVFGMMQMIQQNWQHYLNLYKIPDPKFRNDYALAIASNTIWGHIGKWPSVPWSMTNVEPGVELTQLDNTVFKIQYPDQRTKLRTIIIQDMDFHAMCKHQLGAIIDGQI
jgi:hypothetical protein